MFGGIEEDGGGLGSRDGYRVDRGCQGGCHPSRTRTRSSVRPSTIRELKGIVDDDK